LTRPKCLRDNVLNATRHALPGPMPGPGHGPAVMGPAVVVAVGVAGWVERSAVDGVRWRGVAWRRAEPWGVMGRGGAVGCDRVRRRCAVEP